MSTLSSADRALRRAINPMSTAITMFVQTAGRPRRRVPAGRGRPRHIGGSVGGGGFPGDWPSPDDDDGGAGVREPRRPLPTHPAASQALDLPE
jgi:hypothetical protein